MSTSSPSRVPFQAMDPSAHDPSRSSAPETLSSTNVLIFGGGGIGAFFGSRLAQLPDVHVSVVCRSNYAAVASNGFHVTSPTFGDTHFIPRRVYADPAEAAAEATSFDYLLIATKAVPEHEARSLSALAPILRAANTCVVLMQNGLAVERPFRTHWPNNPIVSCVTRTSVEQPVPGVIRHRHWTRTTLGPYFDYPQACPQLEAAGAERNRHFASLLERTGIPDLDVLDHVGMQFARWHKTAINCAMNPSSVLADGPTNQQMSAAADFYEHQLGVMREVLTAAEHVLGEPLPASLPTPEQVLDGARQDVSGSLSSMWNDWAAERPIELEAIVGEPLRAAKSLKNPPPMPRMQTLYALLQMKQVMRERSQGAVSNTNSDFGTV